MKEAWITCPMCGHVFDPDEHIACLACPLHKHCHLACCPVCGYSSIDPRRSVLAQVAARWLSPGFGHKKHVNEQIHQGSTKE
jgi:rubredoxin